jgi:GNAT superfamily N-acetyltransferase
VTEIDTELDDERYWKKQQDEYGADEWERVAEIPEQAWVKYVHVEPQYRRMGIATGMYEQIKKDYPGIKITSSGTTGEGGKMREKMKERGMFASALLQKKAQYAEGQAMTQHTDHTPVGMYKVLKSNPFADEMEALAQSQGENEPELNPVLPGDNVKTEGQPMAKGEDQIGKKMGPDGQNSNIGRTSSKRAAEEEDFSMMGKTGPFYRIDTMRPEDIAAYHGKRFATNVVNGKKVTVYRAGKPGETLTPGTFLSANKRMAESYQHEGTESFGGPVMYKYEVNPADLLHVENFEASELVWKPRSKRALKLNLDKPTGALADALSEIEERFMTNPMNPKEYMVLNGNTPVAVFEVGARNGKLRLKDIRSLEKGTGGGKAALQAVTAIADKHGVEMELTASPFGDEKTRLDKDQLQDWYRRHNFEDEPGFDPALGYMTRKPKQASNVISGEEVVDYVQKQHPSWNRQQCYQIVGLDAGGDYILTPEYDLNRLEAGDDYDPELAQRYAKMKTPLPRRGS